ncbi:hypothetical protein BG004_003790 [Podila humilis]|nr:hypothetical protein BG004_003790 [Podila humilis]
MQLKTFIGLTLVAAIATTVNSAPECPDPKAFCDSLGALPAVTDVLPSIPHYTKLCSSEFVPDATTCNKLEIAQFCNALAKHPVVGDTVKQLRDYAQLCSEE